MSVKPYNWNRKLLNYLWLAVLISFIVPIINYPFTDLTFKHFIVYRMLIPTTALILIMLVLETFRKMAHKYNDYVMIIGSLAIVLILNLAHAAIIYVMLPLFILPIFVSIFTIESSKIIFSYVLSALSFAFLNAFHDGFHFDTVETITFLFILSSALFLSLELTKRYKQLYQNLLTSVSNEKELLYKNIYMEKLSKTDLPTNLYNHKTFHEYLEKLYEQFKKQPFELHLALLDLDDFKRINDTYGHAVGDIVIKEMADIITAYIDTNDFASRYGGEEFAIIFTDKKMAESIQTLEHIRQGLESFDFVEIRFNTPTVSIGLASAKNTQSKDALFKAADALLYQAKKNGKNQIASDS